MTPTRFRPHGEGARPRLFRPALEGLEGRSLPSTTAWGGFAHDPQHTGDSTVASQPLERTRVRGWCINSAAVDPATGGVLANSGDGRLYRWDLATNSFTEAMTLTAGIGEAYTPTVIGADGTVYAVNNATLFAVGRS